MTMNIPSKRLKDALALACDAWADKKIHVFTVIPTTMGRGSRLRKALDEVNDAPLSRMRLRLPREVDVLLLLRLQYI